MHEALASSAPTEPFERHGVSEQLKLKQKAELETQVCQRRAAGGRAIFETSGEFAKSLERTWPPSRGYIAADPRAASKWRLGARCLGLDGRQGCPNSTKGQRWKQVRSKMCSLSGTKLSFVICRQGSRPEPGLLGDTDRSPCCPATPNFHKP